MLLKTTAFCFHFQTYPLAHIVPITYSWSICSYTVRISMFFFYRISLVRIWYYIVVSHIVLLIHQLTDNGTIQRNDHIIGFVEEVAVNWNVNITKNYRISHTVYSQFISYCISESYVYGITFVYLSIIVRTVYRSNIA